MSNNLRHHLPSNEGNDPRPPPFLAAEYNGRKVAIRRNPNYQETVTSIKRAFSALQLTPNKLVLIFARFEEFNDTLQITEEMWSELLPSLMFIQITLDDLPRAQLQVASDSDESGQIFAKTLTGKTITLMVHFDWSIARVKAAIFAKTAFPPDSFRLIFAGGYLEADQTLAYYNIKQHSTIHMICKLRGGKPIIYLFPPTIIPNIQVQLSLVASWEFSAIYPSAPISFLSGMDKSLGQAVAWTVDAKPDGTLFDHLTGREVTYLFWEAHTLPKSLPSPPSSRPGTPTTEYPLRFDPSHPIIDPSNSVLLPFSKVTGYIDDVLLALGLHTEARTSFITYWLPDLSKHSLIALRFLPQQEYEAAAPMNVTPAPQATTRIFMLFRGVEETDIVLWEDAQAMACKDASIWRDIVGVDVAKATDTSLFRVLEWGGMEVK